MTTLPLPETNPPQDKTTTTTTTHTNTSSSSSGSSGGGKSTPKTESAILAERRAQNAIAELERTYLEVLRKLGLRPSKNLLNLIQRGVRQAWSTTMFLAMVRHTPEYDKKFAGIQWKTGMTEGQYLSQYAQYKARAQDIGVNFTRKEFAKVLKRGVSLDEFSDRVNAISSLQQYGPMWQQFQVVLQERGINVPGGKLGRKEMVKFIMGRGSKQWEQVWQETYLTANLENVAGVSVIEPGKGEKATGGMEITRDQLLSIIKQTEALSGGKLELEGAGIDFAGLGENLRKFNLNYLQRYGVTYADLIRGELGGAGAADIRARGEKILKEQEAFFEPRALPSAARAQQKQQQGDEDKLVQSR